MPDLQFAHSVASTAGAGRVALDTKPSFSLPKCTGWTSDALVGEPGATQWLHGVKWLRETHGIVDCSRWESRPAGTIIIFDQEHDCFSLERFTGLAVMPPRQADRSWTSRLDRIVSELGRLPADWDGDDSHVPSKALLDDLEAALQVLPAETSDPEVEVDSSDGSVTLNWVSEQGASVSSTFTGNGRMFLFQHRPGNPPRSWTIDVDDDVRLMERLEAALWGQDALQVA